MSACAGGGFRLRGGRALAIVAVERQSEGADGPDLQEGSATWPTKMAGVRHDPSPGMGRRNRVATEAVRGGQLYGRRASGQNETAARRGRQLLM